MRRPFQSDFERDESAPFRYESDEASGGRMHTGATGASLGWADSTGRPELTPFGETPDLREDVFGRRELGERAPGAPGREDRAWVSHRGRGPRNFQRTDDRLREAICERLLEDDFVDPSDVTVEVRDGEVTLEGLVPERYMKRRIEDLVDSFADVKEIHNRIRVAPFATELLR